MVSCVYLNYNNLSIDNYLLMLIVGLRDCWYCRYNWKLEGVFYGVVKWMVWWLFLWINVRLWF